MPDPALFRVERYDPQWGGFRNDDITPRDLTLGRAQRVGKGASRRTTQRVRVVAQSTGAIVAQYERGRRLPVDA